MLLIVALLLRITVLLAGNGMKYMPLKPPSLSLLKDESRIPLHEQLTNTEYNLNAAIDELGDEVYNVTQKMIA